MALIQPPGVMHRDPHPVHFLQHDPQGFDGTPEHGGECHVEGEAFLFQEAASGLHFLQAFFVQVDVRPAGEAVLLIPDRLTVAQQDDFGHGGVPLKIRSIT
jgi:hypothetical protein